MKKVALLPDYLLITACVLVAIIEITQKISWSIVLPLAIALLIWTLMRFKLRILSIVVTSITCLSALYLELAVISEFLEFPVINRSAIELILVGSSIFISVLILSFFILRRNFLKI